MLEAQHASSPDGQKNDNIPFGIRALESGVMVEGVWVSRPSSPVPDSPESSSASSFDGSSGSTKSISGPESYHGLPHLELPAPLHRIPPSPWIQRSPTIEKRLFNGKPLSTGTGSFDSPWIENRRHSSSPLPMPSTYQRAPLQLNTAALDALEGRARHSIDITENAPPTYYSPASSEDSSEKDWEKLELIHPALRAKQPAAPPVVDPRSNLDLMQSHRMSHVAETGVLKPRIRRYQRNNDWTGVPGGGQSSNSLPATQNPLLTPPMTPPEGSTAFTTFKTRARSSHTIHTSTPWDSASVERITPSTSELSISKRGKMASIAVNTTPAMDNDWFDSAFPYFSPSESFGQSESTLPTSQLHPGSRQSEDRQTVMTAQNYQRASQVLRKVNSRFEILKPGTLNDMESHKSEIDVQPPEPKGKEKAKEKEKEKGKGKEKENSKEQDSEKKRPKKLQKRRFSFARSSGQRSFTVFNTVRVGETPFS